MTFCSPMYLALPTPQQHLERELHSPPTYSTGPPRRSSFSRSSPPAPLRRSGSLPPLAADLSVSGSFSFSSGAACAGSTANSPTLPLPTPSLSASASPPTATFPSLPTVSPAAASLSFSSLPPGISLFQPRGAVANSIRFTDSLGGASAFAPAADTSSVVNSPILHLRPRARTRMPRAGTLQFYFHRLGFVIGLLGCSRYVDPYGVRGVYSLALCYLFSRNAAALLFVAAVISFFLPIDIVRIAALEPRTSFWRSLAVGLCLSMFMACNLSAVMQLDLGAYLLLTDVYLLLVMTLLLFILAVFNYYMQKLKSVLGTIPHVEREHSSAGSHGNAHSATTAPSGSATTATRAPALASPSSAVAATVASCSAHTSASAASSPCVSTYYSPCSSPSSSTTTTTHTTSRASPHVVAAAPLHDHSNWSTPCASVYDADDSGNEHEQEPSSNVALSDVSTPVTPSEAFPSISSSFKEKSTSSHRARVSSSRWLSFSHSLPSSSLPAAIAMDSAEPAHAYAESPTRGAGVIAAPPCVERRPSVSSIDAAITPAALVTHSASSLLKLQRTGAPSFASSPQRPPSPPHVCGVPHLQLRAPLSIAASRLSTPSVVVSENAPAADANSASEPTAAAARPTRCLSGPLALPRSSAPPIVALGLGLRTGSAAAPSASSVFATATTAAASASGSGRGERHIAREFSRTLQSMALFQMIANMGSALTLAVVAYVVASDVRQGVWSIRDADDIDRDSSTWCREVLLVLLELLASAIMLWYAYVPVGELWQCITEKKPSLAHLASAASADFVSEVGVWERDGHPGHRYGDEHSVSRSVAVRSDFNDERYNY